MTVSALACPNCGAPVRVTAAGQTLSVVCGSCGSTLDAATPELRLLARGAMALARPEIALGTRATLGEVEWEAVGYLERDSEGTGWREYLLFNPWEGYRWLIDADDGLKLGEPVTGATADGRSGRWRGQPWWGKRRYRATVVFALGEFPWRVQVGETVAIAEYEAGDAVLSEEQGAAETSWTLLTPAPPGTAAAFGLATRDAPWPPLHTLWPLHLAIAGVAAILILLVTLAMPSARQIAVATVDVPVNGPAVTTTVGPITLPSGRHRVAIRAMPGIDMANRWVNLDYALVDRRTQQSWPVDAVAERYNGVDAEGSWSEGDQAPQTAYAGIPGGTYDLVVEASAHSWPAPAPGAPPETGPAQRMAITVERGGTFPGNLVLALVALFGWPGVLYLIGREARPTEDEW